MVLGPDLAARVLEDQAGAPTHRNELMDSEPIAILVRVVRLLDELGIPYTVGGSLASSAYGAGRTTRDVDLVVDLRPEQMEPLARALEADFYVSRDAMREAVHDGRSFNAIQLDTAFKVDFFVSAHRLSIARSSAGGTP